MKHAIYPFPTLKTSPELQVTEVRVDDEPVPHSIVQAESRVVNLFEMGHPMRHVKFKVELVGQPGSISLFESEHGKLDVMLVASCRPTNTRDHLALKRSELDPSRWFGQAELDRDNYSGKVSLTAVLTGNVGGGPHRPVGFTDDWSFYFNPAPSFHVQGSLKVSWCDFKSDDARPLAQRFSDSPYVIDLDNAMPEVLLNSSFDGLEPLLRDRQDRTHVERALHDIERIGIARSVWMALLGNAMSAVKPGEEDEEPDWPDADWQCEVLRQVLPVIEPNLSESELLRLATTEWREFPGSTTFFSRAEAVIGEIIGANKTLRKSMQDLARKGVFDHERSATT